MTKRVVDCILKATSIISIATLGVIIAVEKPAFALDTEAHDFYPLSAGTSGVLVYYLFNDYDAYHTIGSGGGKSDTHVQTQVGIARYVHYYDIGGVRFDTSIYQTFGGYSASKVNGNILETPGVQLGDLSIDTFAWPVNNPEKDRFWAIGGYIHIPDGSWDRNVSTNLSSHRFSGTVQTAYIQGITSKFDTELVGDATFYGDNNEVSGGGTLSEQPTYEGQLWVNYNYSPLTMVSFGASATFGGYQSVNGVGTGDKTENEQIKFSYAHTFAKPGIQFLLEADHTVHVVGGFNERIAIMARIAKVF